MTRNKGTFQFAANFEVKAAAALDPRVAVATKAELIQKETWPYDGDTIYLYKGILVSVQAENAIYMLIDTDKILFSDYSGWLRVDAGNVEQLEVINSLDSDATDKALSAKQGKVLMGEILGVKAEFYTKTETDIKINLLIQLNNLLKDENQQLQQQLENLKPLIYAAL